MDMSGSILLKALTAMAIGAAVTAAAQTSTPPAPATPDAAATAPAAAPDPKPWRLGPMDVSGFADGFYTYNANHPSFANNGQSNDFYNFNDSANAPDLSAAKLTFNH